MKQNILILQCLAEVPEEALRVMALLQAGSFGSLIPGQIVSGHSVYHEFMPKCYDSIPSSQIRDFYANVCVEREKPASS